MKFTNYTPKQRWRYGLTTTSYSFIFLWTALMLASCGSSKTAFNVMQDEPRTETERLYKQAFKTKNAAEKIKSYQTTIKSADVSGDQDVLRNAATELASLYYSEGKYKEAEPLFLRLVKMRDEALLSNPFENPLPWYPIKLPLIYETQNKNEKAEELFLLFLKNDEMHGLGESLDHFEVSNALIDFYMRHEDWKKANALLVKTIRLRTDVLDNSQVHKIAICAIKLHDPTPAIEYVRRSIALAEEPVAADTQRFYLAPLYADLGDCLKESKDLAGANAAYKKALSLSPGLPQALDGLPGRKN